MVEPSKTFSEN